MLILAVAVVAVRAGSPGTVEAATGDIGVLNVGTCYTTDDDAFGVGDCDDGDGDEDTEGYSVGGVTPSPRSTTSLPPTPSTRRHRAISRVQSLRTLTSLRSASTTRVATSAPGRSTRLDRTNALTDNHFTVEQTIVIETAVGDDDVMAIYGMPTDADPPRDLVELSSATAYFDRIQGDSQLRGNHYLW